MWWSTAKTQFLSTCLPLRHKHSAKSTFHVQLHCAHYLQTSMTKPLQSHPSKEIISCTASPGMKSGLRRYMWLYNGTVEEIMKALFIKCLINTSQSTTPHYSPPPPIIHIGSDARTVLSRIHTLCGPLCPCGFKLWISFVARGWIIALSWVTASINCPFSETTLLHITYTYVLHCRERRELYLKTLESQETQWMTVRNLRSMKKWGSTASQRR